MVTRRGLLEVEVNASRSAFLMAADGSKVRMRRAINDTRGYTAELLTKANNQGALDQQLTAAERRRCCRSLRRMAQTFQQRSVADQIATARVMIDKLHPGHGADLVNPVAINWHKVPYSLGPWPAWNGIGPGPGQEGRIDKPAFRLLQKPDGRVYFATTALSQTPGWQEGGIQSARLQVTAIAARAAAQATA